MILMHAHHMPEPHDSTYLVTYLSTDILEHLDPVQIVKMPYKIL